MGLLYFQVSSFIFIDTLLVPALHFSAATFFFLRGNYFLLLTPAGPGFYANGPCVFITFYHFKTLYAF
jgi:hypothetical protein